MEWLIVLSVVAFFIMYFIVRYLLIPKLFYYCCYLFGFHSYKYHNHYFRECTKCGREQSAFRGGFGDDILWCEMKPGNGNKFVCNPTKNPVNYHYNHRK